MSTRLARHLYSIVRNTPRRGRSPDRATSPTAGLRRGRMHCSDDYSDLASKIVIAESLSQAGRTGFVVIMHFVEFFLRFGMFDRSQCTKMNSLLFRIAHHRSCSVAFMSACRAL